MSTLSTVFFIILNQSNTSIGDTEIQSSPVEYMSVVYTGAGAAVWGPKNPFLETNTSF